MKKNYAYHKAEKFSTIKEMITRKADYEGVAFKYTDGKTDVEKTYREFYLDTVYLGTMLTNMGLEHKHIACIGKNSYEWLVVYLSVLSSNNIFVPIDKDLPEDDILNIVKHSEAEIVFCDEKYKDIFSGKIKAVSFSDEFTGMLSEGKEKYDSGDRCFLETKPNDVHDMKLIIYTSGTTGTPKGVMLSEDNIVSCIYYGLWVSWIAGTGLSVLPYHHTYESVCSILVGLHVGATTCINADLIHVLKNFKKYKPNYIMLVPAFAELFYRKINKTLKKQGKENAFRMMVKVSKMLRLIGIDKRKTFFKEIHEIFGGNLEKIVCGGAPIRPEIGKFFDDIGITLISGYGITECSPLVSLNRDKFNDPSTVGVLLPCVEVEIDNPNEEGIGEIKVKGKNVMLGYYKDEQKTAEVFRDGWFYTGDYGRYNKRGQLMITGRKKNVIVLENGKNIYPEEIEEYLGGIEEIKEVLVCSRKSKTGNEKKLAALVYIDPEMPISFDELTKKINDALSGLASYKQIREIVIMENEFEKTTSNKIKRHKYVEM